MSETRERDPRTDPRPGDVLARTPFNPRTIQTANGREVRLTHDGRGYVWSREYFLRWAAGDEVLHREGE